MDNNLAVVVSSFDEYCDIWDIFFALYNKYWPENNKKTYLITNNLVPKYDGVKVINVGYEKFWTNRLRKALKTIKEDYILLLLEDYLLKKSVDSAIINKLLNYASINNVDYLRLVPIPKVNYRIRKEHNIYDMREDTLYCINLQPAIWNKEFLLKALGNENYSAWEFEKTQKCSNPFRTKGNCKVVNYWAIHFFNGLIKGKWQRGVAKELEKRGISINLNRREIMSIKEDLSFKIRKILSFLLPVSLQKRIKPILKKMGFKFTT